MRKALGRGLDALIPGAAKSLGAVASAPAERELPIDHITPNPRQPRTTFDEDTLEELSASIRANGMIQPLLVRPCDSGFELVAGERRLRAAQRAGLRHVPVVVRELSDAESLEIALIENVQRSDLSPLEEAAGYQRLVDEFGHTQEAIAAQVGKSRSAIANSLRLLRLPEPIKQDIARGRLTAGHARALLSLDDADAQLRAARQILTRQMSVRETEKQVSARRDGGKPAPRDPHRQAVERELGAALGTRVRIRPRGKGGTIEIEYYSLAELQGLAERIQRGRQL
jgi:ParB family transcriptional regulator, chromosome partitioning protein